MLETQRGLNKYQWFLIQIVLMKISLSFKRIGFSLALSIVSSAALCLTPASLTAQEADDPKAVKAEQEKREQFRKQLEEKKKALQEIESKKAGVKGQVAALDKDRARLTKLLIDYAKRIQKSESSLDTLEARLKTMQGQEKNMRRSLQERRVAIGEMLGLLQRMGRNPPPIMATHKEDALQMVRSAMLMSNLVPKLNRQAEGLKTKIGEIVSLKKDIAQQSERLRIQNAEMETDRIRLKELLSEKKQRILDRNRELQQIENRAKEHSKSVASLGELIKKVDQDLQRRTELGGYEKQLIEDEKIAQQRIGKKVSVELSPDEKKTIAFTNPGRIEPALPFSKVKHTLSLPARGRILRTFGEKMKYGNRSKGISIETRPNAQITSPSDGWIAYAGKFRSYGQLLIINAGGGYHILLAGMDRIDVKIGQFVLAGEPIGSMIEEQALEQKGTKKTNQPVLYIEFRKDSTPIDPSPWWANDQIAVK